MQRSLLLKMRQKVKTKVSANSLKENHLRGVAHVLNWLPPMNFQEQIDRDLKEAMKARETDRLAVLRMLKAALKNAAIEKGGADAMLDEAEAPEPVTASAAG